MRPLRASAVLLAILAPLTASDSEMVLAQARDQNLGYQRHLQELSIGMRGTDAILAQRSIRALSDLRDPEAVVLVSAFAAEDHPASLLSAAATALGRMPHPLAGPTLRALTRNADPEVRNAAYLSLCALGVAEVGDHVARLRDPHSSCHVLAVTNLGASRHAPSVPVLCDVLHHHRNPSVRMMAAIALRRIGDASAGPVLQDALMDPDPEVRKAAADGIAALRHRQAIPFMLLTLEGNEGNADVYRVLRRMIGVDIGYSPLADARSRRQAVDRGFAWWMSHKRD